MTIMYMYSNIVNISFATEVKIKAWAGLLKMSFSKTFGIFHTYFKNLSWSQDILKAKF